MADLFQIGNRFLRSTQLERDYPDPEALAGYVLTPTAKRSLERLYSGLAPRSTHRTWRVTGDYGTGKSSFALALSHLCAKNDAALPPEVNQCFDLLGARTNRPKLLPVLATGSRTNLAKAILDALSIALKTTSSRGTSRILDRIKNTVRNDEHFEQDALQILTEAAEHVRENGTASGLLIVLDELGKFLEFAALYPQRQDVYFLQLLAELAAGSKEAPILVVGLLHQGFQAYYEQLSNPMQKEWEKVAGRFEEILFDQPLEQASVLVANALNVRVADLPSGTASTLSADMEQALKLGWYGATEGISALYDISPKLYPLHPTTLPILVKMFSRFGQNERSLYSFLLSNEPNGLQDFANQPAASGRFYRIHHLYDYARAAFGHRLAIQSYRSHWNQIESVIESFPRNDERVFEILKTIAVLNLIDSPNHVPTDDSVALAVAGVDATAANQTKTALRQLQREKAVLYFRGAAGGYCLWPHTSVNLERAYQEAYRNIPIPTRVGATLRSELETRPLVARRHYIESGNLRHFSIRYAAPADIPEFIKQGPQDADGLIIVAMCETIEEQKAAITLAQNASLATENQTLMAIPQPLSGLASLLAEAQRWEWVAQNVPELSQDTFAQEEVSRQLAAARHVLQKRVRTYIGIRQFGEKTDLQWYYRGRVTRINDGRELLEQLSVICDTVFTNAPLIRNELVNRHNLSSAASAARLRLIDLILTAPEKPFLGMDHAKKPPEMSMYLSVMQAAGLHCKKGGMWQIRVPSRDICRVRLVLLRMLEILERDQWARVKLTDFFSELRSPPFGLRDGLASLFLAIFIAIHKRDVAFYENGRFVRQITVREFQRLAKAPWTFEIQYCKIGGVRAIVFEKLYRALNPTRARGEVDLLDVVMPIFTFASELPLYTQRTALLSPNASAIRSALSIAEEPATLLFRQLPTALGLVPFENTNKPSSSHVQDFVKKLKASLDELGRLYPELISRLLAEIQAVFQQPGNANDARQMLAGLADRALVSISEPRLKAFCLRLADRSLPEREWIESIGSFVLSKPPSKWFDNEFLAFRDELGRLARQFRRVESTIFSTLTHGGQAMRIAITRQDGTEVEQVLQLSAADEQKAQEVESVLANILRQEGHIAVVAAARAVGAALNAFREVRAL